MSYGKILSMISGLMVIVANSHLLERAVQGTTTSISFLRRVYISLEKAVKDFAGHQNAGIANAIMGGIMIMIIGFATLVIGNYIVYAIVDSMPALSGAHSASYNATLTTIVNYATTVIPLFGLVLMVLGFAIILYTLRSSMEPGGR